MPESLGGRHPLLAVAVQLGLDLEHLVTECVVLFKQGGDLVDAVHDGGVVAITQRAPDLGQR